MDWHPIQGGGGVEILLVTSCYRNWNECWPDGLLNDSVNDSVGLTKKHYFSTTSMLCQQSASRGCVFAFYRIAPCLSGMSPLGTKNCVRDQANLLPLPCPRPITFAFSKRFVTRWIQDNEEIQKCTKIPNFPITF